MARVKTTITNKDGSQSSGYIDSGKTYYDNGSRIGAGSSVTDSKGRQWTMGSNGSGSVTGYAEGSRPASPNSPASGKYNPSYGYSGGGSSYYDQYQSLLDQQLKAQQDAIAKQTQATVDSINAYKPQVEQSYADQQKANYISNAKNQSQMGDYLGAMGYSGGMAESTMANLNNAYQNNRSQADTEKNNAMSQIQQQVAQAQTSGDASAADAMSGYYTNYLSALQNQQQMDYQKQLQEQENYANTIGADSNDYMAKINQLKAAGVPEDDYRLRLLYAARNEKIANQKSAQAEANQQALDDYYKQQNLALKQAQVGYQINKPYYEY